MGDIDLHLESCLKPKWEKKKIPKRHSRSLELGHKCQRKNKYIYIFFLKAKKIDRLRGWVYRINENTQTPPCPKKKTNVEDDKREHL